MYLSLQGRKALVIAGERRIGKDICLSFAREGVDLASCDISVEDGSNSRSDQRPDHAMNRLEYQDTLPSVLSQKPGNLRSDDQIASTSLDETDTSISQWIKAGTAALGIGGKLITAQAVEDKNYDGIERRNPNVSIGARRRWNSRIRWCV